MISINKLSVNFGGFDLFKDITFLINRRDRIGLVGKNGAGKSTILKIIYGVDEASKGTVAKPKDVSLGYLPQQMKYATGFTVKEETEKAFIELNDLEKKIAIIHNAVEVFHGLGNPNPKVAIVGSVETVNPKMEATMHAATISMMNYRKQIQNCIIDGPLAIDNAVSKKAAELKNITSDVAGDVDIILGPDIDGANILYKSLSFLGGASAAAVIMGAKVPIVLTSRADSEKSKFLSIALAAAIV